MSGRQYMEEIRQFQEVRAGMEGATQQLPKSNSMNGFHVRVET